MKSKGAERKNSRLKFNIPTTFFDLVTILLAMFMLISVINFQKIQKEYQVKIDMLKKEIQKLKTAMPGTDTPTLTIALAKKNAYRFIYNTQKTQTKKEVNSVKDVRKILTDVRPSKLIIRIDKRVPSGVLQTVLLDCQDLGILPFLSAKSK